MKVFINTVVGIVCFYGLVALGLNHQQVQSTERQITCSYDPQSSKPNPLGMRTFITGVEKNGNSIFIYEQFPSVVTGDRPITIENKRTLTFYETKIEQARIILRENPDYYSELVGYDDPEGFDAIDEVLKCK